MEIEDYDIIRQRETADQADRKTFFQKMRKMTGGVELMIETTNFIPIIHKTHTEGSVEWIFLEVVIKLIEDKGTEISMSMDDVYDLFVDNKETICEKMDNIVLYIVDETNGGYYFGGKRIIIKNIGPNVKIYRPSDLFLQSVEFYGDDGQRKVHQYVYGSGCAMKDLGKKNFETTHLSTVLSSVLKLDGRELEALTHLVLRGQVGIEVGMPFVAPRRLVYLEAEFEDSFPLPMINVTNVEQLSTCSVKNVRLLVEKPEKILFLSIANSCTHQDQDRISLKVCTDDGAYTKIDACARCGDGNTVIIRRIIDFQKQNDFAYVNQLCIHWPSLHLETLSLDPKRLKSLFIFAQVTNIKIVSRVKTDLKIYSPEIFSISVLKYIDTTAEFIDHGLIFSKIDPVPKFSFPNLHYIHIVL